MKYDIVIEGARVVDPAQNIDRVTSVAVAGGKIAAVGDDLDPADAARRIDARGKFLSPGWIDMHVHTYSHLAFSHPDTIGVLHGVTTVVDAGGAGAWTYDDCRTLLGGAHQDRHLRAAALQRGRHLPGRPRRARPGAQPVAPSPPRRLAGYGGQEPRPRADDQVGHRYAPGLPPGGGGARHRRQGRPADVHAHRRPARRIGLPRRAPFARPHHHQGSPRYDAPRRLRYPTPTPGIGAACWERTARCCRSCTPPASAACGSTSATAA